MPRDLPPLIYLQAFEAAARHLSFTAAAQELNCTQAAISQRIRALEQIFARPLFHRHRNALELTEIGLAYVPGVTEALDVAESATQGIYGRPVSKTVTLSAPVSFLALVLAPRLASFTKSHPDIEVRLNGTIWTDPHVDLADLSIRVVESVQIKDGMHVLSNDGMILVCAPDLAPGMEKISRQAAIETWRPIQIQGKHQLWPRWIAMEKLKAPRGNPPIKVDNAVTALELAASGAGLAVPFSFYARPLLASGRLIAPFGDDRALPVSHIVETMGGKSARHAVQTFRSWLIAEFSSLAFDAPHP